MMNTVRDIKIGRPFGQVWRPKKGCQSRIKWWLKLADEGSSWLAYKVASCWDWGGQGQVDQGLILEIYGGQDLDSTNAIDIFWNKSSLIWLKNEVAKDFVVGSQNAHNKWLQISMSW